MRNSRKLCGGIVTRSLAACPLREAADAILIDMHAEATSEKMAMGQFCDGRASCVVGSHSHIPTGDAQILPHGTGYQTDAGACADYDSVIGMEKFEPLQRFTKKMPTGRMTPAMGPATLCAVFVETDRTTGLALRCEPVASEDERYEGVVASAVMRALRSTSVPSRRRPSSYHQPHAVSVRSAVATSGERSLSSVACSRRESCGSWRWRRSA